MKRTIDRKTRHARVRARIQGTTEVPRLSVFRSNKHVVVQLVDDQKGQTLVSATDTTLLLGAKKKSSTKQKATDRALMVGEILAKKAREKNIMKVVFDRGGFIYTGNIKALAEGARKGGLKF